MSALRLFTNSSKCFAARGSISAPTVTLRTVMRPCLQHMTLREMSDSAKPPTIQNHSSPRQPTEEYSSGPANDRKTTERNLIAKKDRIVFPDGAVYTGDVLENGDMHGFGVHVSVNGAKYEGDYVSGKQHGHGKVTFPHGGTYTGDFFQNAKHGRGVQVSPSGLVYDGEWVDNVRNGKGKLTFSNGDVYEGDFVKGSMHGNGTTTYKRGGKYEGGFAHDKKHGKGKLTYANGDYYAGDFVHNKMHGLGKKVNSFGVYLGEMRDDKPNGLGQLVSPDGVVQEGLFQDGRFIGNA